MKMHHLLTKMHQCSWKTFDADRDWWVTVKRDDSKESHLTLQHGLV